MAEYFKMSRKRIALILPVLLLAIAGAGALPARASMLYSDFGPSQSYDTGNGYNISWDGSTSGTQYAQSMYFTATTSGTPEVLDAAFYNMSSSSSISWGLNHIVNGTYFAVAGGSYAFSSNGYQVAQIVVNPVYSGATPVLIAGDQYVLQLAPSGATNVDWMYNDQGVTGGVNSATNVRTLAAFDFSGTQSTASSSSSGVPEPSNALLLLLAVSTLALLRCGQGTRRSA